MTPKKNLNLVYSRALREPSSHREKVSRVKVTPHVFAWKQTFAGARNDRLARLSGSLIRMEAFVFFVRPLFEGKFESKITVLTFSLCVFFILRVERAESHGTLVLIVSHPCALIFA